MLLAKAQVLALVVLICEISCAQVDVAQGHGARFIKMKERELEIGINNYEKDRTEIEINLKLSLEF